MISIIIKDGDKSKISVGKASKQPNVDIKVSIINGIPSRHRYSEAPYYYKHKSANGNNRYYMLFANDWSEKMKYTYFDNLKDFLSN